MMAWISFQIYRWFLFPLSLLILTVLRIFIHGKLRTILEERRSPQWPALSARPIWIHAASGEIEYAKPVIRIIKENYPHIPVLVTYFSPSAKKLIKDFPGVDCAIPSPWDSASQVGSYLKKFNPLAIMYARTDVWPELATQARAQKIPQILFAATLSEDSSRASGPLKYFSQWAFQQLDRIDCVSVDDAEQFQKLGLKNLSVSGDTRYDQVLFRIENPKKINLQKHFNAPVLVAGSTWPADEEVLFPALKIWIENKGQVILAPHEVSPDRLDNLQSRLTKMGLQSQRYSQHKVWHESILIIDEIGILPEVYAYGDLAFVGGSFKGKVHSVMEPLACGLPVLVGPYHKNNREALQFQNIKISETISAVEVVQNSSDLQHILKEFLLADLSAIKNKIQLQVHKQAGCSQKQLNFLSDKLGLPTKS